MRSDELFTEIKFVIENFGEPLTLLFEVRLETEFTYFVNVLLTTLTYRFLAITSFKTTYFLIAELYFLDILSNNCHAQQSSCFLKFCSGIFYVNWSQQYLTYLPILQETLALAEQHAADVSALKIIFNSLVTIAKCFYSLNYQDLPEFFEDNMSRWFPRFLPLLKLQNKLLYTDVSSWKLIREVDKKCDAYISNSQSHPILVLQIFHV